MRSREQVQQRVSTNANKTNKADESLTSEIFLALAKKIVADSIFTPRFWTSDVAALRLTGRQT